MARATLVCATCSLVLAAIAASSPSSRPSVRPIDLDPLVVRLAHFKASEDVVVRVVVRGGRRYRKTAETGVRGGLTLRFQTARVGECSFFSVIAVGSRGSRATYTMHPPPCGPGP